MDCLKILIIFEMTLKNRKEIYYMNIVFGIVLFPILWVLTYLYRIIWFDLLNTIFEALSNFILFIIMLFSGHLSAFPLLFSCLYLIITLPVVLILEIPIGIVVTLIYSLKTSYCIFKGEIDFACVIKQCFKRKKLLHNH